MEFSWEKRSLFGRSRTVRDWMRIDVTHYPCSREVLRRVAQTDEFMHGWMWALDARPLFETAPDPDLLSGYKTGRPVWNAGDQPLSLPKSETVLCFPDYWALGWCGDSATLERRASIVRRVVGSVGWDASRT